MTPWQSKEDQRAHIRAQLEHEIKNPATWYPYAKPEHLAVYQLKYGLYKKEEDPEEGA